jgi:hypothetical protein
MSDLNSHVSGKQHRVISLKETDISEMCTASIIMVIQRPDDEGSTHL